MDFPHPRRNAARGFAQVADSRNYWRRSQLFYAAKLSVRARAFPVKSRANAVLDGVDLWYLAGCEVPGLQYEMTDASFALQINDQ